MKKPSLKDGAKIALSLGIIILLAVIIGGSARLFFDKVSEELSAPPTREERIEFTLKGAPIPKDYALYRGGRVSADDSSGVIN